MAGDPDQGLIQLLSPEQRSTLASLLGEVIAHGHGDVTLHVKDGSVWFLRATVSHKVLSEKLPKLQQR
jgi:hypothetical protein